SFRALNLSLAKPNASDAGLLAVLEQVRLARFVQSLSGQLDGWVGEGGNTLSTGQKRRLCLARILLTPASVWVLDEPLSGLDKETALALLQDMLRFAEQRTVIMVSHDPVPEGLFAREMQVSSAQLLPLAAERSFYGTISTICIRIVYTFRRADGAWCIALIFVVYKD